MARILVKDRRTITRNLAGLKRKGLLVAGGLVFFFIRRKKVADQDEA